MLDAIIWTRVQDDPVSNLLCMRMGIVFVGVWSMLSTITSGLLVSPGPLGPLSHTREVSFKSCCGIVLAAPKQDP